MVFACIRILVFMTLSFAAINNVCAQQGADYDLSQLLGEDPGQTPPGRSLEGEIPATRAGEIRRLPRPELFDSDFNIIDRFPKTLHRVTRVISANTILLDNGDKVRMEGVELTEKDAEAAYRYVSGLLEGKKVRLEYGLRSHDIEGNILATVYKGDLNVNDLLKDQFVQHTDIDPAFSYSPAFLNSLFPNRNKPLGFWELTLGERKVPAKKLAIIKLKAKDSPIIKGELLRESEDFLMIKTMFRGVELIRKKDVQKLTFQ